MSVLLIITSKVQQCWKENDSTAPPKINFYSFLVVLQFYIQPFLLCDAGLEASESLQVLQLSFNKISTLQPEDLSSLRHLTELHLQHNLISSLHPHMFQNLTKLKVTIHYFWN